MRYCRLSGQQPLTFSSVKKRHNTDYRTFIQRWNSPPIGGLFHMFSLADGFQFAQTLLDGPNLCMATLQKILNGL